MHKTKVSSNGSISLRQVRTYSIYCNLFNFSSQAWSFAGKYHIEVFQKEGPLYRKSRGNG